MIPKSVKRFSDKIMRKSKRVRPARTGTVRAGRFNRRGGGRGADAPIELRILCFGSDRPRPEPSPQRVVARGSRGVHGLGRKKLTWEISAFALQRKETTR